MNSDNLDKNINWKRLNDYVRESLKYGQDSHDYEHIKRVLKYALKIAEKCLEVDYNVLVGSCLLHDIANRDGPIKDHNLQSGEESQTIVKLLGFNEKQAYKIRKAIEEHRLNQSEEAKLDLLSIESKILKDAHALDNLGSFGIIKIIARSLKKDLPIIRNKEDILGDSIYGNVKFLLTLPDKMLTSEGKKIAEEKTKILIDFLNEILGEK
jgi:uncharacterized protein